MRPSSASSPPPATASKLTRLLIRRRKNIARVIHNFQELSTALARRDRQLAALVDSANANFEAFASEEAALREALQLFPGALDQTETTLVKTERAGGRARARARAAASVRPQPRPGAARDAARSSARPRRSSATRSGRSRATCSRPCVTCARPPPRPRRGHAAPDQAASRCSTSFFNILAYNPPGSRRAVPVLERLGAPTPGRRLSRCRTPTGPVRRGVVLVCCSGYETLEQRRAGQPAARHAHARS